MLGSVVHGGHICRCVLCRETESLVNSDVDLTLLNFTVSTCVWRETTLIHHKIFLGFYRRASLTPFTLKYVEIKDQWNTKKYQLH